MMRLFVAFLMMFMSVVAHADVSAGDVAGNASDILETVTSVIVVILYIAAMGVFVSACMKYRIHRQNPQQIPLSTPITELVLAIVLAALPTVSRMTNEHLFNITPALIQSSASPQAPQGVAPAPAYPVHPQQQPQPSPYQYTPPQYQQAPQQ